MKSRVMFNEKQKQEYIKYEDTNMQGLTNYFKRIGDKEREHKKDIADMSVDEIKDTIISLNLRREDSIGHLLSLLRGYVSWARLNKNALGGDSIDRVSPESFSIIEVTRCQMLSCPEHLKSILDSTLDYVDYENRARRDALIFWLLYEGVKFDELKSLKKNSLYNNVITTDSGKVNVINNDIKDLWVHVSEIIYLERKKRGSRNANDLIKNKDYNEYIETKLCHSDLLFRPIAKNKISEDAMITDGSILNIVSKVIANYSQDKSEFIKIPPSNIRCSGIFYRFYLTEKRGEFITPEMFAERFDVKPMNNTDLLMKTRGLRIDYDNWKVAFGYM